MDNQQVPDVMVEDSGQPPPAATPAPATAKLPDYDPPQAVVQRVVKTALPENCSVTKESKAAFTRAAGIFIVYLTSCANDFCMENKRQTISSADVLAALKELEFDDFVPQVQEFLDESRKEATAKKLAAGAASTGGAAVGAATGAAAGDGE